VARRCGLLDKRGRDRHVEAHERRDEGKDDKGDGRAVEGPLGGGVGTGGERKVGEVVVGEVILKGEGPGGGERG
jgi:hypothetical protein